MLFSWGPSWSSSSSSSSWCWGSSYMMMMMMMMMNILLYHCIFSVEAVDSSPNNNKKVFLLAGPHHTGTHSVHQFLFDRACTFNNTIKHPSFENWTWPNLEHSPLVMKAISESNIPIRNAFDLLVAPPTPADNDFDANEELELHMELLNTIKSTFQGNEDEDGDGNNNGNIVIGSAMFERIGDTPYTNSHGMDVMKELIQHLNVPNEQVTVVLNYRVPRVEHWLSSWRTHHHLASSSSSSQTTNNNDDDDNVEDTDDTDETLEEEQNDYKSFVCASKDSLRYNKVIELLSTTLHPLYLANSYIQQGWNVIVIDMGGMKHEKRELPHVIACDAMIVPCNSHGKVLDLWNVKPHLNENDKSLTNDIIQDLLSTTLQQELNTWFEYRDCLYEEDLLEAQTTTTNQNQFQILLKDTIFEHCESHKKEFYKSMTGNVTEFYNRIRTQMNCNDFESISEEELMKLIPEPPSPKPKPKQSWLDDTDTTNDSTQGNESSGNGSGGLNNDNGIEKEEEKKDEETTTTMEGLSSQHGKGEGTNNKKAKSRLFGKLEIPIFFMITFLAGTIQMVNLNRQRLSQNVTMRLSTSARGGKGRGTRGGGGEYRDEPSSTFEGEMVNLSQTPSRRRNNLADEYGDQEDDE